MPLEESAESDHRSRQKKVGDALRRDTRNRLLEAAKTEFTENGYAGTTVNRLAAAAGVSLQTLYLTWGSKRELLRGYVEHALAGGAGSPEDAADRFAGLPPHERLSELADLVAEIAGRAATGWRLYRDAAAVDPDIAADWNELQKLRHRLFTRILTDIPTTALRDGLTTAAAIDTAWTIASPESYELLVHRRNYDVDRFRNWMEHTLTNALLTPSESATRAPRRRRPSVSGDRSS